MLLLTGTSDLIQVITGSALALDVHASWTDLNSGVVSPGRTNTPISTAATTTVVGSPGASTQRNVQQLSLRNKDAGAAQTVTVQHFDGTNTIELVKVILAAGERLQYEDANGWSVFDAQGNRKQGFSPATGLWRAIVNVIDYGARGDGATNDAAAIQAAITAAGALGVSGRGVDVWFPPGVYAVGSTIVLNANNVMLIGAGWQSTILYATFTTTDILQIGNGSSKAGCGLKNMSVWCNAARTTGASINVNAMNDCVIENFVVNNCFQGILVQGASIKVWIRSGEINNIAATTGVGVQVTNGAAGDTYLTDLVMSNPPASKPAAGIQITQTGHMSILRCNITSCVKGLHVNPSTSQDVTYLFIDHSLFDSCGSHAAHFNGTTAATSRIRSVMCMNSWFSGTTAAGSGIEFTASGGAIVDALSFVGCRILNNFNHGVTVNAGPTNISFTDCSIAGNGQQTVNTYDGISIVANASGISAVNCKIGQSGAAGNQQRYAVNVAAGTSANLMFAYNDCQPNGTVGNVGYINLGAITGGGNILINNQPGMPRSFGNARTSATAAFTTTETIVTDTTAAFNRLFANAIRAGGSIRFTVSGTTTITTAAGTTQWRVRLGTNNTTSDGVIMDSTAIATGGVGGPIAFKIVLDLTFRTIGATATCYGTYSYTVQAAAGGVINAVAGVVNGTASTFSTQNANYINLTGVGSANASVTVQMAMMEAVNT